MPLCTLEGLLLSGLLPTRWLQQFPICSGARARQNVDLGVLRCLQAGQMAGTEI